MATVNIFCLQGFFVGQLSYDEFFQLMRKIDIK